MMIKTLKPYGCINDLTIQFRFEQDGKFYVVDKTYNTAQVEESEYKQLTCPVKKYQKKVR